MKVRHFVALAAMALLGACRAKERQKQESLIRDCPEEKIVNRMPTVRQEEELAQPSSYFIYKGKRRELSEFDLEWLEGNCKVKETIVH